MKTIHPAVAEHVMEENARFREALRRIADLPIDRCTTENDYRLAGAKAVALAALSQQAEPVCDTCHGQGEVWTGENQSFGYMSMQPPEPIMEACPECGGEAESIEPAPAQDEQAVAAVIGFYEGEREPRLLSWNVLPNGEHRLYTRPAQTEQQPIRLPERKRTDHLPKEYKTMTVVRAGLEAYNRALDDVAALNAAPVAKAAPRPTGLSKGWNLTRQCDGFVIGHSSEEPSDKNKVQAISDGYVYVPFLVPHAAPQPEQSGLVEAASGALAAIQDALEDAYHNAYPECCGQAHLECCGSPLQAWSEADQKTMERFAPHEKALRAALSAQGTSK